MKNQINLSVPKPCQEKWSNFDKTEIGGYCSSCQTNVIDFTVMTDDEIKAYFRSGQSSGCGRFLSHQLRDYNLSSTHNSKWSWIPAGLLSLLLLGQQDAEAKIYKKVQMEQQDTSFSLSEKPMLQGHTLRGTVVDEDNEPLPGASVYIKGDSIGTVTDIDGAFEFPRSVQVGEVLVFSFIGFEHKEVKIKENMLESLEVMLVMMEYDIMGEVVVVGGYQASTPWYKRIWNALTPW
ncbi:carboxypeptidase-like regulatory domain-containing protein [Reichenbachiella ulvae]|uniref:Carboxypeptidase-like regulatory domain-containing protein n=1 Tax=Reichenbachiella ulvae TaxID=2980104 RepID=A0ABT3CQB5_9BACT|nr:carboxypeptidase-like regulatory domain-containing protein [Reichenbachiella ulvae]MCV9385916.1 carboxypeptidase-like regulatory domain-containing protein [Reichenbachiella ulvae]